jgi:hypothetical protein
VSVSLYLHWCIQILDSNAVLLINTAVSTDEERDQVLSRKSVHPGGTWHHVLIFALVVRDSRESPYIRIKEPSDNPAEFRLSLIAD